jgi:hypothetical protein
MKRKGLAKVDHTPPIEPEDLKQMYCSVALNPNTPVGLQQKVWFDVMFFLCRRGRKNLRTMTKTSFGMKMDRTGTYVYQAQDELDKNNRERAYPLESNTDGRMYEVPGTIFTNIILNILLGKGGCVIMHFQFYSYEKCKISCVIGKYCYFVNRYSDWFAAMFSVGCETQRPSYPFY